MLAVKEADLRFRAGDVGEPFLADGDASAAIQRAEHLVDVGGGEGVDGRRRFCTVPLEEGQASGW